MRVADILLSVRFIRAKSNIGSRLLSARGFCLLFPFQSEKKNAFFFGLAHQKSKGRARCVLPAPHQNKTSVVLARHVRFAWVSQPESHGNASHCRRPYHRALPAFSRMS